MTYQPYHVCVIPFMVIQDWTKEYKINEEQEAQLYIASQRAKTTLDANGWGWEGREHPTVMEICDSYFKMVHGLLKEGAEVGATGSAGRLMVEVINVDSEEKLIDFIFYVEMGDTF